MLGRTFVLSVITLIAFAAPAMADFSLIGTDDPVPGNSWSQRFSIMDTGEPADGDTFDLLEIYHYGGTLFEDPWIEIVGADVYSVFPSVTLESDFGPLVVEGEDIGRLTFDLHFAGDAADSQVKLQFQLWEQDTLFGEPVPNSGLMVMALWNGTDWVIGGEHGCGEFQSIAIPVPAAALLGMLGMAAAGWGLRKMC